MERLGVAIIGLGMASKPHLEALKALEPVVDLRGVWTRSPTRAAEARETHGLAVYESFEALLADPAAQAAIVLTPPDARREIVGRLAAAGKHILMEKPIERTAQAAVEIVQSIDAAGVTAGMVFQHRFRPGALRLRELILTEALGPMAMVRLSVPWWRPQEYYDVPGRGGYARDGGGVLITQAIHAIDLMLSLAGPVSLVQSVCATTRLHSLEAEDFAAGGLRFASGAVGSIMATTAAWPGESERLDIDALEATARFENGTLTVSWRDGREEEIGETSEGSGGGADPMAFSSAWHQALIADFIAAIRDGRPTLAPPSEALHSHALIEAMTESSRQGRAIEVPHLPGAA